MVSPYIQKTWWWLQMSLREWFGKGPKGDWVDIGAPKKKGKYQPCGRKSASKSKRGYPKCVPRAKARSMSKSQIKSAVQRKRARAQGVGGKPTNVKTIVSKKKTKKQEEKLGEVNGIRPYYDMESRAHVDRSTVCLGILKDVPRGKATADSTQSDQRGICEEK